MISSINQTHGGIILIPWGGGKPGSGGGSGPIEIAIEDQPLMIRIDPEQGYEEGEVSYRLPQELVIAMGSGGNQITAIYKDFVIDYVSPLKNVIMETETGGVTYRYTYGLDKLSTAISGISGAGSVQQTYVYPNGSVSIVKLWYHHDRLGSTEFLSDNVQGKVTSYVSYDDWGALTMKINLQLGSRQLDLVSEYTGHPYDPVLGVYYARARMYDAADRRFMAVDLIGINITASNTYNTYTYVWNNPAKYVDPFGLVPEPEPGASITITNQDGVISIISVYMEGNVVYVNFTEALDAYGATFVETPNAGLKQGYIESCYGTIRADIYHRADGGTIWHKNYYQDKVVGTEYYRDMSNHSPMRWITTGYNTDTNLVTWEYFQKLMCDTGWSGGASVNVCIPTGVSDIMRLTTNEEKAQLLFGESYNKNLRYYNTKAEADRHMKPVIVNAWKYRSDGVSKEPYLKSLTVATIRIRLRRGRQPRLLPSCCLSYNKRSNWPDVVTVGLLTSVREIISHPLIAAFGFGR